MGGSSAVHAAAASGHTPVLAHLAGAGAELSRADMDGHSPLRFALDDDHLGAAEFLRQAGVPEPGESRIAPRRRLRKRRKSGGRKTQKTGGHHKHSSSSSFSSSSSTSRR